jgi:ATP phosphoribosyltransferase
MRTHDRLRIAIQKSGRLSDPSRELLAQAGLQFHESRDRLFCHGQTLPVDLLLVRDDDIPGLLADGTCDLGIVGRNLLEEGVAACEARGEAPAQRIVRTLGFGQCRLSVAVPQEWEWTGAARLAGTRIATSYPGLLRRWLDAQGVAARPVVLSGSVEIAPRLGTADAVCDLVSSGATLAANQLREVAVVFESEAVLAGPVEALTGARGDLATMFVRRLDGVLARQSSRLLLFQAPREAVAAILRHVPESDPPTVTPIEGRADEVALQALCRTALTWQRLEDMKRAGASGLMVLPVERMLR